MSDKLWESNKRSIVEYYDGLLDQHGATSKVADASSEETQKARYRVLSQLCNYDDGSVLDIGCGLGWFGDYLCYYFDHVKYTGLDLSEKMIRQAEETYRRQKHEFICGDILSHGFSIEPHDIVICNGIFYKLQWQPYSYMFRLIRKAYSLANEAVAFNCLNGHKQSWNGEFWARPDLVLAFAMDLCPRVILRADYLPQDFTVFLYKK